MNIGIIRKSTAASGLAIIIAGLVGLTLACSPTPTLGPKLSGTIEIDGSSTVFPITEAVAEEFGKVNSGVRVNVGVSGTGGGFKRLVAGETAISNASRPISESEKDTAAKNGIEYIELHIGIDGLAVLVNVQNAFATCLTTAELKRIWEPGSQVKSWKDFRADFPDQPIRLYGPGTDSGTFDYFTEVINGKAKASRSDYTASEDDNFLVQGIKGDRNALGYFGYAYYAENPGAIKLVAVDPGTGCVIPSEATVKDGTYKPLSRPLYIYINKKMLAEKPELQAFAKFYLEQSPVLVKEVGYVPLETTKYQEASAKLSAAMPAK